MTVQMMAGGSNWWMARWAAAAALLSVPLVTQVGTHWHPVAFVLAGSLIASSLALYEFAARSSAVAAFRAGVGIAAATSFLIVWINVVAGMVSADHPANLSFFGLVLTAAVGAFAAGFRAAGLARAMLGVAGAQALLAVAIATAPSTEVPLGVLMLNAFFVALWLVSAGCFWKARGE